MLFVHTQRLPYNYTHLPPPSFSSVMIIAGPDLFRWQLTLSVLRAYVPELEGEAISVDSDLRKAVWGGAGLHHDMGAHIHVYLW